MFGDGLVQYRGQYQRTMLDTNLETEPDTHVNAIGCFCNGMQLWVVVQPICPNYVLSKIRVGVELEVAVMTQVLAQPL